VHLDHVAGVLVADLIDQRLLKPPRPVIDIKLRDGEFACETAHAARSVVRRSDHHVRGALSAADCQQSRRHAATALKGNTLFNI
jgi:hypothetical protein